MLGRGGESAGNHGDGFVTTELDWLRNNSWRCHSGHEEPDGGNQGRRKLAVRAIWPFATRTLCHAIFEFPRFLVSGLFSVC